MDAATNALTAAFQPAQLSLEEILAAYCRSTDLPKSTSDEPQFVLGLTMAGAVSAGAYNAGVFDFLVQALDEWEKAKAAEAHLPKDQRTIPDHRVVIPVITGASAGGITAALGLVALGGTSEGGTAAAGKCCLPLLYDAWVNRISFTGDGSSQSLLSTSDLSRQKDARILSLLDASVIDDTARQLIRSARPVDELKPYLAEDLHLFLTITNLRGIPYRIGFEAVTADDHVMSLHSDRVHYCFGKVGSAEFESTWLSSYADSGLPLDLETLRADDALLEQFLNAAIGTGAFPLGLPARLIRTKTSHYAGRAWPFPNPDGLGAIDPAFPPRAGEIMEYEVDFACSDGGIMDNEPFEIARWTIMKEPGQPNEPSAAETDRAVLLVDPFPEPPSFDPDLDGPEAEEQIWLRSVLAALFPALKNEARVKAIDLARSRNPKVFSRFLIAPSRQIGRGTQARDAAYPLASGVLGAFGGFLAAQFPEHDYQLGRRNCQQFLRKHFVLPIGNRCVDNWPPHAKEDANKKKPTFHVRRDGDTYRTLIPLVGSAREQIQPLQWPQIGGEDIQRFISEVRRRGDALVRQFARKEITTRYIGWIVRGVWCQKRRSILRHIRLTLEADLIRRDQHADWQGLGDDLDRLVLAALFEPRFHARTPKGIAREVNRLGIYRPDRLRTSPGEVKSRLDGWMSSRNAVATVVRPGVYQLRSRRRLSSRLPLVDSAHEWLDPLSVD